MKVNTTIEGGERESQSHAPVSEAIDWLQTYIDEEPYTDAANEARSIINRLRAVRRPALDELLGLIGQIAKTDEGLQEINRAKLRMSEPEERI